MAMRVLPAHQIHWQVRAELPFRVACIVASSPARELRAGEGGAPPRCPPVWELSSPWIGVLLFRVQRPQICRGIGDTDHCVRPSVLLTVEGRGFCNIEAAGLCVFRIIEPEPHVKSVRRAQACVWVEAKYLVEQDCIDYNLRFAIGVSLHIGLVPGQPKIHEIRVSLSIGQQICVLNCEEVESEMGLDVRQSQRERVTKRASLDQHAAGWSFPSLYSQAGNKLRLSH